MYGTNSVMYQNELFLNVYSQVNQVVFTAIRNYTGANGSRSWSLFLISWIDEDHKSAESTRSSSIQFLRLLCISLNSFPPTLFFFPWTCQNLRLTNLLSYRKLILFHRNVNYQQLQFEGYDRDPIQVIPSEFIWNKMFLISVWHHKVSSSSS